MISTQFRMRSCCKVNLALAVLGRRADSYHEIRTVLQTINLSDEIEFQPSSVLELECPDLDVPVEQNLVWKAARALSSAFSIARGARITLRKRIPSGAGLGGGSGNAATTLLGLARLWQLNVLPMDLGPIASTLGSDVPFFLQGGTALGAGRGEEIYPLPEPPPMNLVVLFPGVHVSTTEAYKSLNLELTSRRAVHRIQNFCGQLAAHCCCPADIFNDFETSILPAFPAIQEAKDFLKSNGATATLLSGSGSSVFGFFVDEESALAASRSICREGWRGFPAKTLSRAEYFHHMCGAGAGAS